MVKHDIPKPVFDAKKYDPEGMNNKCLDINLKNQHSWQKTENSSKDKIFSNIIFKPVEKTKLVITKEQYNQVFSNYCF